MKCIICQCEKERYAKLKNVLRHLPELEKSEATKVCVICYNKLGKRRSRGNKRNRNETTLKTAFRNIKELSDNKDFSGYIKYCAKLEFDIQKMDDDIEEHIRKVRNITKIQLKYKQELESAVNLAENHPELMYWWNRYKASRHISKVNIRAEVFSRDGFTCNICGTSENLTVDHIVPVLKGGGNELDNLQTLCGSCNSSKGAK
jgi:hypothetical protein